MGPLTYWWDVPRKIPDKLNNTFDFILWGTSQELRVMWAKPAEFDACKRFEIIWDTAENPWIVLAVKKKINVKVWFRWQKPREKKQHTLTGGCVVASQVALFEPLTHSYKHLTVVIVIHPFTVASYNWLQYKEHQLPLRFGHRLADL